MPMPMPMPMPRPRPREVFPEKAVYLTGHPCDEVPVSSGETRPTDSFHLSPPARGCLVGLPNFSGKWGKVLAPEFGPWYIEC